MTIHDKGRFLQAFNRLAVAVRLPADQADAVAQRVYWDGLKDLPLEAVEDAARELQTGDWFPKLGQWRDATEKARNARMIKMALPAGREMPWAAECETCDDTGWETLPCAGEVTCGRLKEHQKHTFVVACACRGSNRTYQRRLAEQRERSRTRAQAGKQSS